MKAAFHHVQDDGFEIALYVGRGDPHRIYAVRSRPLVAGLVALGVIAAFMSKTVDFDRKCGRTTEKIENEAPAGVLPSKLQTSRAKP